MSLFFIHGWATTNIIWSNLQNDGDYCYHAASFPNISELATTFELVWTKTKQHITIVGWSLGGMLALELARLYPDKVKKLILISSTARFTTCENYNAGLSPIIVKNLARKLAKNKYQTQLDFYKLMFAPNEMQHCNTFIDEQAPLFEQLEYSTLHAGLKFLLEKDLRSSLASINVPCQIIHGQYDTICPPSAGEYLANYLPNAQLTLLPETGHIPFYTQLTKIVYYFKD